MNLGIANPERRIEIGNKILKAAAQKDVTIVIRRGTWPSGSDGPNNFYSDDSIIIKVPGSADEEIILTYRGLGHGAG